jgi:hypothetical protein
MAEVSPTTGEVYYSGGWEDIKRVLRVFDIDEGKLAVLEQPDVNEYQEMVDREIDAVLEDVYHVPLRAMNQVNPLGNTVRVFPGDVRRAARYWTAALLLLNEFQQLSQNLTEQATTYVEDSRRQIFAMKRYTHRIPGQERKSHFSRTIPPNFQPPSIPEPDF